MFCSACKDQVLYSLGPNCRGGLSGADTEYVNSVTRLTKYLPIEVIPENMCVHGPSCGSATDISRNLVQITIWFHFHKPGM